MSDSQLHVVGQLNLELDHFQAYLEAKGREVEITFPSFAALRRFNRVMHYFDNNQLSLPAPLSTLLNTLDVSYRLNDYTVGRMGPGISPNWGATYTGVKHLNLDTKMLVKAFFGRLFK